MVRFATSAHQRWCAENNGEHNKIFVITISGYHQKVLLLLLLLFVAVGGEKSLIFWYVIPINP
jgi:hypothetical protein